LMAAWLKLADVWVTDKGEMAADLKAALAS
jgi:hypothetical protein